MPTISVDLQDLETLIGKELPRNQDELSRALYTIKGEVEELEGGRATVRISDTNRPDLWCTAGMARALRLVMGIEKPRRYPLIRADPLRVFVGEGLENIRPYIACALIEGVKLHASALEDLIQYQDKLDSSYGRNRMKVSIGLYDFSKVKPPLFYEAVGRNEVSFIPLGWDRPATPEEILRSHPKGLKYGHLLAGRELVPIFRDSEGRVLSFPPVINSADAGKVTEDATNLLIEATGMDYEAVLRIISILALTCMERGGTVRACNISYPREGEKVSPDFSFSEEVLELDYVSKICGAKLDAEEVIECLERAGLPASLIGANEILVQVPPYRIDVMHQIDLVEDVIIIYGLNRIRRRRPQITTYGGVCRKTKLTNTVREALIGFGYQEVANFILSSEEKLFVKTGIVGERAVELENPMVKTMACLRNWLLPSLLEVLSYNTAAEYPQRIFEVGDCVVFDLREPTGTKTVRKLAFASAHSRVSYTEVKGVLQGLSVVLGLSLSVEPLSHNSFIEGRCAAIIREGTSIGVIGEVHPQVLEAWEIGQPVAAVEINLDSLLAL